MRFIFGAFCSLALALSSTTTFAVESGHSACILLIEPHPYRGSRPEFATYTCDGQRGQSITFSMRAQIINKGFAIAQFVNAGYRLVQCNATDELHHQCIFTSN